MLHVRFLQSPNNCEGMHQDGWEAKGSKKSGVGAPSAMHIGFRRFNNYHLNHRTTVSRTADTHHSPTASMPAAHAEAASGSCGCRKHLPPPSHALCTSAQRPMRMVSQEPRHPRSPSRGQLLRTHPHPSMTYPGPRAAAPRHPRPGCRALPVLSQKSEKNPFFLRSSRDRIL